MNLVAKLKYEDVDFKFISSHYDIHLKGTCMYNGELHKFQTMLNENIDLEEVHIFSLTGKERKREEIRQWLFELCVGYHCSYIDGSMKKPFYVRSPEWLYTFLFYFYYNSKIIKPLLIKLLLRVKDEN